MYQAQIRMQNIQTDKPLIVPIDVVCNTPDEVLIRQIKQNSAVNRNWVKVEEETNAPALMLGGGPSLKECMPEVKKLIKEGAKVFAMNGVADFLQSYGITADYQVIVDARERTKSLIGAAKEHLFASQVHPSLFDAMPSARLWHLDIGNIEEHLPEYDEAYALIGGHASVGNSALGLAYALGYREFHVFGYDSSYKGNDAHAYAQPMNATEPTCSMSFGGEDYIVSITMKVQAERFPYTAQALKDAGCEVKVYGDGLLQKMYRAYESGEMAESDKYKLMWGNDAYRQVAPGELCAQKFLEIVKPQWSIIDFGCGTGRGALAIHNAGHEILCVDFASNSRDEAAMSLPFIEWDLTNPLPISCKHGYCTDVMEHIEPEKVERVIRNIMAASDDCFFQISTVPDVMGELIGQQLHLTVENHSWWAEKFKQLGYTVAWEEDAGNASLFHIKKEN